jgi:hypothetical protein
MKPNYTWSWDLGCWIDARGYGWEFERFGRSPGWAKTIYTRRN